MQMTPHHFLETSAAGTQDAPLDFELLFRSAPSLLLVLEPAPGFRILAASDAYLRATRSRREAVIGRPLFEAFPENPDSARPTGAMSLRASMERVIATRTPDALNAPVLGPDGRLRYILHRIDSIELELLRSARERDEAIRQLESANEELEAFAYSASHDLQAPLRAIEGFCQLLHETHGQSLDAEGRRFLARINVNVKRMGAIIEDLLALSRIGKTQMSRRKVDLSAVAQRIVAELRAREPARRVEVEIAPRLEAWGDERLVVIALENLIGNAWKYTGRKPEARIEVGKRDVVGQSVFYVKDNGAGFDMAFASKLFTPFVRLHGVSEFEGTGIGLATVKRIVERHGGEIWAEAQVDLGATIHFTLASGRA